MTEWTWVRILIEPHRNLGKFVNIDCVAVTFTNRLDNHIGVITFRPKLSAAVSILFVPKIRITGYTSLPVRTHVVYI